MKTLLTIALTAALTGGAVGLAAVATAAPQADMAALTRTAGCLSDPEDPKWFEPVAVAYVTGLLTSYNTLQGGVMWSDEARIRMAGWCLAQPTASVVMTASLFISDAAR